jgi:hypothetical protein
MRIDARDSHRGYGHLRFFHLYIVLYPRTPSSSVRSIFHGGIPTVLFQPLGERGWRRIVDWP